MDLWLYTDAKLHILVHPWKCFSFTKIINKKTILEGIYLCRNTSTVSCNSAILELV